MNRFKIFMNQLKKVYDVDAAPTNQRTKIWNGLEICRTSNGDITVMQVAKIHEMARTFKKIFDETVNTPPDIKADHPEYVGQNH